MAEPTSGNQLAQQFQACRPAFCAIGDETRQLILRVFIENCGTGGLRVGELQASTNLSRAAVSHHLKVLKDAGIITFRREGTKITIIWILQAAACWLCRNCCRMPSGR